MDTFEDYEERDHAKGRCDKSRCKFTHVDEYQPHVPNMPWVKCVHCGEQEPMVVGWTMVTRRGVLEQRCIDDF